MGKDEKEQCWRDIIEENKDIRYIYSLKNEK